MILRIKGIPNNIDNIYVGKICRNIQNLDSSSFLILDKEENVDLSNSLINDSIGVLSTFDHSDKNVLIKSVLSFDHLKDGDIVYVSPSGNINTLYRVDSIHNTLLVTERCNSNCLMCSQPPKDKDDIKFYYDIHKKLIPLIPKDVYQIGISGGEPTLLEEYFYKTIKQFKYHLPDTWLHILSNGRLFAWQKTVEKLKNINHDKLLIAIPVYSDSYDIHDYVVQSKNAFYQTIQGIYNLHKFGFNIEIRIVLHSVVIPRLYELSKFIFKNLTFVDHVAFMGLEHTGYTPYNFKKLWVDPYNYQNELQKSVEYLDSHGLNVSIYNLQLCLLPKEIWQFAEQSISDWKNIYIKQCDECVMKDKCAGFFKFNKENHSEYIKPIYQQ